MTKRRTAWTLIALILVAALSATAVLAYFAIRDDGGNQNLSIGKFDFTMAVGDESQQNVALKFPAPTLINFPAVSDNPARDDDADFNAMCVPVWVKLTNTSDISVSFAIAPSVAGTLITDKSTKQQADALAASVSWFVFDDTAAANIASKDYAAALHKLADPANGLNAAQTAANQAIAAKRAPNAAFTALVLFWLDYDKLVSQVDPATNQPILVEKTGEGKVRYAEATLTATITVTCTQAEGGEVSA